jgi:hypothetical protein
MNATEALRAARAVGVTVNVEGDDLVLEALGPPPAGVIEMLARAKASIVDLLRSKTPSATANDWQTYFRERVATAPIERCPVQHPPDSR